MRVRWYYNWKGNGGGDNPLTFKAEWTTRGLAFLGTNPRLSTSGWVVWMMVIKVDEVD